VYITAGDNESAIKFFIPEENVFLFLLLAVCIYGAAG
jgi:hypothetical protein